MENNRCHNCDAEINTDSNYCSNCGSTINKLSENDDFDLKNKKICKKCNHINDLEEVSCVNCGKILEKSPTQIENDRKIAIILVVLFIIIVSCFFISSLGFGNDDYSVSETKNNAKIDTSNNTTEEDSSEKQSEVNNNEKEGFTYMGETTDSMGIYKNYKTGEYTAKGNPIMFTQLYDAEGNLIGEQYYSIEGPISSWGRIEN